MDDARLFSTVRQLINARDPEGLLDAGAPEDEYDPEVLDLVGLVRGEDAVTAESVADVFLHWFGWSVWVAEYQDEVRAVADELESLRAGLN